MASIGTKTVVLEGFLGEKYGRNWNIVADTYADIFACIDANYPGFKQDLIDMHLAGGDISVQVGGNFMEEAEELLQPVTNDTIIIVPLATGSSSGTAKILTAIAIVGLMWWNPLGWAGIAATAEIMAGPGVAAAAATAGSLTWAGTLAAGLALNLAITGLQQLMAPDPSVDQNDTNYLFNGPENTVVAGNPVPVLCGEMIIGGIVISSGVIGSTLSNDANYVIGDGFLDAYGVGNGTSLTASDLILLTNQGLIGRATGVII